MNAVILKSDRYYWKKYINFKIPFYRGVQNDRDDGKTKKLGRDFYANE